MSKGPAALVRKARRGRAALSLALVACLAGVLAVRGSAGAGLYEPSGYPDRVVLTLTEEPATSVAVTWRTDATVGEAWGEIAEAEDGPEFRKKARRVKAATEAYTTDQGSAHAHSVVFEDLKPDTLYVYRVGDGERWSEWNQTRTAAGQTKPFRFLYLADAQNDIFAMWSRVVRQAFATAPDARFIVHAGDLIASHNRDEQWGEWHAAAGWIHRTIPAFPTPGNHEYGRQGDGERRITVNWRPQFTLPRNGPAGLEETCYWVDIQGLRMIALNSNEKQQEQAAWLEGVLASNPMRWTVVVFHHPLFSAARGRDNRQLRELWLPVIERHGVDVVLHGHDHTYARTALKGGTVYVVSVSGPKMYELTGRKEFVRVAEDTQFYQVIAIDGDELRLDAYTARGELYDAFTLRKRAGGAKELISRTPARAPRVRERAAAGR